MKTCYNLSLKSMPGLLFFFYLCLLFQPEITSAQRRTIARSKSPASSKKVIKYGLASYYAKKFRGRTTSNGAIYNSTKLSAACNILPLGTWVKVTNLHNKRSVTVMINDRLHRKSKRLIDLSKFAAQKLAYIKKGVTRVRVEVLNKPAIRKGI